MAEKSTPTPTEQKQPQQRAVWYFIGATFIFVAPNIYFDDMSGWPRLVFVALGLMVMIAGFVQLRRDFKEHSRAQSSPPPETPEKL